MSRFAATFAIAFALWAMHARPALAQQNLFNVPSSDITDEKTFFFQQQFNFNTIGQSNTTLCYGLGRQLEIGLNLLDLPFYSAIRQTSTRPSVQKNPDLLFNAQKGFDLIEERWKIGIGTQTGANPAATVSEMRLLNYTYFNNVVDLPGERGRLIAGAYFANHAYGGAGRQLGFQAGVEVPVWKDVFHFQADYISGKRDVSVGVAGGVVYLPRSWQLSFGGQFPSRGGKGYGGVLELTWAPRSRNGNEAKAGSDNGTAAE